MDASGSAPGGVMGGGSPIVESERLEMDKWWGLYDRIRDQVKHENELYNQRIIWLLSMQAFLVATVGLVVQAAHDEHGTFIGGEMFLAMSLVIASTGILVALVSNNVLTKARNSLDGLEKVWGVAKENIPNSLKAFIINPRGVDPDNQRGVDTAAKKRDGLLDRVILFLYIDWFGSGKLPLIFILMWVLYFGAILRFV